MEDFTIDVCGARRNEDAAMVATGPQAGYVK
jgi:hypothetical protein